MKLTRMVLLAFVLVVSVFAAPEAFGAKMKGGKLSPNQTKSAGWWIDCGDGGALIPCGGSYDYCVGYCDGICGGGPGSCA
jgi:hypothetical protein